MANSANAYIDLWTFKRGDGGGTEVFSEVKGVVDVGGFGITNDTIDVTNFSSGGVREYIAGLADGSDITMTLIRDPAEAEQEGMRADVNNKVNRNFQFVEDDGAGTSITYTVNMAMVGWVQGPAYEDKSTIDISMKISGTPVES
ncbi:MAG: hypothetical protein AB9Q22_10215 [Candidatus Reddybacter sp.]